MSIGEREEPKRTAENRTRMRTMIAQALPIRVLVVDDSSFMRNTLSTMLMRYPDIQVVGTAKNGQEALVQVAKVSPDVMTLDVDMPEMNGLEVLDRVMANHPLPVVMVSSLTQEGAHETFQALSRGAFDFISKHQRVSLGDLAPLEARLYEKIKSAFHNKQRFLRALGKGDTGPAGGVQAGTGKPHWGTRHTARNPVASLSGGPPVHVRQVTADLVLIGGSTGGTQVLNEIFRQLPTSFPVPILIVQHMPKFFTTVFASQLAKAGQMPVQEGQDGDFLEARKALVAPGDHHVTVTRNAQGQAIIKISEEPRDRPYWPCIDLALTSAAKQFGSRVLAIIMTGMGHDGLAGCQDIKRCGGKVLVQDELSSMVYGMNRAVWEAGLADETVSGPQLANRLMEMVGG